LPRGNQQAASAVVMRLGLTARQTEALVDDALDLVDPAAREALLVRRLDGISPHTRSAHIILGVCSPERLKGSGANTTATGGRYARDLRS
jgi:hypothetical protein